MTNRVSVIMPTYNRTELLLTRSLPSVLNQTHRDIEVHIVADGMTEWELIPLKAGLSKISDMRISLWNIERPTYPEDPQQKWCVLGINARNFGLDKARGDWIASLDDDDQWEPNLIEVLLGAALRTESDFAYCQSDAFFPDRVAHYGQWPPGHFAFCDGAYVYRNGMGFRYDWKCLERGLPEDGDLWDRMVEGGVKFTFVEQVLHHYYPNPR